MFSCSFYGDNKEVKIPATCQALKPFTARVRRVFSIPENIDVSLSFEMGDKTIPITSDQELVQYLPFVKTIVLTKK